MLGALSQPRALWRQSRRHARRLARLFRQGAAAADARRGGAAGGAAAVAGSAPARPLARRGAARARPRARPRCSAAASVRRRGRAARKAEPVPSARRPMPMLAPHAAEAAVAAAPDAKLHRLTIDARCRRASRSWRASARARSGPTSRSRSSRSINATGEVLARVGSSDYFDLRRAGQVDMTQARALARLDAQAVHLRPRLRGRLHPSRDADRRPAGALRRLRAGEFRSHLPGHRDGAPGAAAVAQRAGGGGARPGRRQPLRGAHRARPAARWCCRRARRPGLAMGLGGVGVTLADLVTLYAGLARGGTTLAADRAPERGRAGAAAAPPDGAGRGLVCRQRAASARRRPRMRSGGRIAFKTGTSYGYRDAWAVGFDGRATIGVWVGRPDGAPCRA